MSQNGAKTNRKQVPDDAVAGAMDALRAELGRRLSEKGQGTFASKHEVLGVVTEEYEEVSDAVHRGKVERGPLTEFNVRAAGPFLRDELLDLAVACVFGVACIDAKTMDW
jgi:hypothetical protein